MDLHELELAVQGITGIKEIHVEIKFAINTDVPSGYVENGFVGDNETYKKVLDAVDGIATRTIELSIPQ